MTTPLTDEERAEVRFLYSDASPIRPAWDSIKCEVARLLATVDQCDARSVHAIEQVSYIAQAVHQAYHDQDAETWHHCHRSVCNRARLLVYAFAGDTPSDESGDA